MLNFKRLSVEQVNWEELDCYEDRTVFETLPWLRYIEKSQHAEPVIAAIEQSGELIGYFTGLMVKKYGVKILGSPFRGWITLYMGFNLLPGANRREVLKVFPSFVFDQLKCHYFEIYDLYTKEEDYEGLGYSVFDLRSFEIDLTKSEEELYANMKSACRNKIRKAQKNGVYIEEVSDLGFVDDYYDQLTDVFAKQSLLPTYPESRVREMINQLLPTESLLLLRARNKDGLCIATGIFPGFNNRAYYLGGASWREYQKLRPNEPMIWYAMRYWKARGIKKLDMWGADFDYKRKYGVSTNKVPRLIMSKYGILDELRDLAIKMIKARRTGLGHLT